MEDDENEEEVEYPQNVTLVYPNPSNGDFYILMTNPDQVYRKFTICAANGTLITKRSIEFGLNEVHAQGEMLSGLYTITFEAEDLEPLIKKMIILN